MTLNNIFRNIVKISDDEQVNHLNYMSALPHIDKLYKFIGHLSKIVSIKELEFAPSYKDINIAYDLHVENSYEESNFQLIIVKSPLFLGDEIKRDIEGTMLIVCNRIELDEDVIKFYLN